MPEDRKRGRGWLARTFPAAYPHATASMIDPPDGATVWVGADVPQGPAAGETAAAAIAAARAARVMSMVTNRDGALANSVVNRSRDIVCGVLSCLPFTVTRDRAGVVETLPAGWLDRPDPTHSHAWFVSWVTDDLFFHGHAMARITVEDADGRAVALQWMPWVQLEPQDDGETILWRRGWYPDPFTPQHDLDPIALRPQDVVVWESPLVGVLGPGGPTVLTTGANLDASAARFAATDLAAGYLKQDGGEPVPDVKAQELVERWADGRAMNAIGFLNQTLSYHESEITPDRLQMVESRSYQDAQAARVCNVPNFAVGVGVPNDSMTYKTALTARLDLLDFGLAPLVQAWGEALSNEKVTPRGTTVAFDLEPFLRTDQLTPIATTPAPVPAPTGG